MTEAAATPSPADIGKLMPFAVTVGIEFDGIGTNEAGHTVVDAHLDHAEDRCTAGGAMHGGALMTLADSAGAACAFLNLPPGATTTTVNAMTNFFRAVRSGTVSAHSSPLHLGRTVIVVQTDLTGDDGKPVARVTQTQAVQTARK